MQQTLKMTPIKTPQTQTETTIPSTTPAGEVWLQLTSALKPTQISDINNKKNELTLVANDIFAISNPNASEITLAKSFGGLFIFEALNTATQMTEKDLAVISIQFDLEFPDGISEDPPPETAFQIVHNQYSLTIYCTAHTDPYTYNWKSLSGNITIESNYGQVIIFVV